MATNSSEHVAFNVYEGTTQTQKQQQPHLTSHRFILNSIRKSAEKIVIQEKSVPLCATPDYTCVDDAAGSGTPVPCISNNIENNHLKLLKELLQKESAGLTLECEDPKGVLKFIYPEIGYSLLQIAVIKENVANLEKLISEFKNDLVESGAVDQISTRTPNVSALHLAAQGNFPEGISLLLDLKATIDLEDSQGLTPLQCAAFWKNTEAARCLIEKGAQLNNMVPENFASDLSTLALVLRRTPKAADEIEKRLDQSIKADHDNESDKTTLKFDFKQWQQGEIHLLHVFATEYQNSNLMEHPLVRAMVDVNWKAVKNVFYARLVFAMLLIFSVGLFLFKDETLKWLSCILIILLVLECTRKLLSFISYATALTTVFSWKTIQIYLCSFVNWCQVFTIYGLFVFLKSEDKNYVKMIGPMVFLAGWFDFMVMICVLEKFFGLHLDMFYCVIKQFVKIFLAFSIFLVGFLICFWLYFYEDENFSTWYLTAVKIIVMFVGELDYNDLIDNYTKSLRNGTENATSVDLGTSTDIPGWYIIFPLICIVMFVVAVPIVLMNLLLGQVVSDIADIRRQGLSLQLRRKAEMIQYLLSTWNAIKLIFFFLKENIFCGGDINSGSEGLKINLLKSGVKNSYSVPYYPHDDNTFDYYHRAYDIAFRSETKG